MNQIIVLIGLPGAGKTTIAAHLVECLRGQHVQIETFRDNHAGVEEIAEDLATVAYTNLIVFECSGASDDFEEILQGLVSRGISCFVVNLEVTPTTALRRLESRIPYAVPKVSSGWSEHVDWVQTRLRLVPTDVDIDTEMLSSKEVATVVIDAWNASQSTGVMDTVSCDTITFSKLYTWQVCGREYGYRHIWRVPPTADLPSVVTIAYAAHEALSWLFAPGFIKRTLTEFLDIFSSKIEVDNRDSVKNTHAWGRQLLSTFYNTHYMTDDAETLAVESDVTLPLSSNVSFVGRLDRLSLNAAGELEVTEFKLRQTRRGSRPRVPELLQPAAYAAAVMIARQRRHAFVRLHFIDHDRIERVLLSERGARNVRLALLRWLTSLQRRNLVARPGYHCRHCGYRLVCPFSTARTSAVVSSSR